MSRGALSLIADEERIAEAIVLSLALRQPVQHCLYLAVAESLRAALFTADAEFAPAAAAHECVRLLS